MEAVKRIAPQSWMSAPETAAVVAALTAGGATVRFVGGCVRDSLLGRQIGEGGELDLATPDPPEVVMALLEAGGLRAIPTGLDHGTVTALVAKRRFEITTLRRDVETFGRRARVAFSADWEGDAARRDFTMNALYLSPEGELFDPVGGLADLKAGRVRFVGAPAARIDEDLLRILRLFRFHAHYGRLPLERAALAACRARAGDLKALSAERVRDELLRLLAAPAPGEALALMAANGVLGAVLPEARALDRLARLVALEAAGEALPEPERRLAAALSIDRAGAEAVARRLKLSNAQAERLALLAAPPRGLAAAMDERAARRALYDIGPERFRDLALLAWAGEGAGDGEGAEDERWRALLAAAAGWRRPEFPLRGADLLELGVAAGPEVGRLLRVLEAWWIEGDFTADRDQALERLRAEVAASGGHGEPSRR